MYGLIIASANALGAEGNPPALNIEGMLLVLGGFGVVIGCLIAVGVAYNRFSTKHSSPRKAERSDPSGDQSR